MHTDDPDNLADQLAPTQLAHSVSKAAKKIDLGTSSMWKLIRERKVKTIMVLNRRLVPDSELQRLVSEAA